MSTKDDLSASVPILVGPNWIIWEAQMKAYLRTKGLWQLVVGNEHRPENLPTGCNAVAARAATQTTPAREAVEAIPFPDDEQLAARHEEQADWDNKDDQALGIITLKISHSLRTHVEDDAYGAWNSLSTAFATPGPAAIFNDFAKIVNMRLHPNKHPAANMNTMWDLFERLRAQDVQIPANLRALILLNAVPSSLQSVVTVTLQTTETANLTFESIRDDITTIYEQTTCNTPNAHKLSAVKRKGGDPQFSQQRGGKGKRFQPSDQPDCTFQEGSSKDGQKQKHRKRGSGKNRGRGGSRGGGRGGHSHESHDHSHIGSNAIVSLPTIDPGYERNFPALPSRSMIALQPSRATPQTTTIVSFNKNKVSYRTVDVNKPVVMGERNTMFPENQRTLNAFQKIDQPMTVQNFKNVDKAVNKKGKKKTKDITMEILGKPSIPITSMACETESPEQPLASTTPLTARITSPDPVLSWFTDEEMYDAPPPKTTEDIIVQDDPYNFYESDDDATNGKAYYTGNLGWGETINEDIAEAAGFDSGFINERQVFLDSSNDIYSHKEKSAFLAGNSATEQDLQTICNSINKYNVHASSCEKCKENKLNMKDCQWIMDSGASKHFTPWLNDFADFRPYNRPILSTAAKSTPLQIKGEGTVFLSHTVKDRTGNKKEVITRFYPVYHVPGMSIRLMSLGELLLNGCEIRGNADLLYFLKENRRFPSLSVEPHLPRQIIFWLHGSITDQSALMMKTIDSGDYDLWHQRLGHPSKHVLFEAQKHVKDFPKGILFPNKKPLCRRCAEGKMHSQSFPESQTRATKAFQRIHSDLKSFAVESYHRYRYLISFIDDYTSNAWVILLRNKDNALDATKNFVTAVETQYQTKIQQWMSDAGGEYKSQEFDDFLKSKGIKILQSVPHQPEQNGRAERFNRTIMDKAQALRFTACLPQSWWEFSILHAVHLYNRTPVQRLNWKTPFELLNGEKPSLEHLRVFGCAAHVFLHEDIRVNKLSPKSELMIFLGYKEGVKGFLFMRQPNNVLFTGATALFDEKLFLKCPEGKLRGFIPVGEDPSEDPSEVPISLDDGDDGPNWPAPNPPIPKREDNQDRDDDSESPPPEEPIEQPPCRSGRTWVIPSRPDNVYGDRTPTEIIRDVERQTYWKKTVEGSSSSQQQPPVRLPLPNPNPNMQRDIDTPLDDDEATLLKLQKEGGVRFILYLVNKAIPRHDNDLPSELNVQNWTFRDILRLPAGEQKKWKDACHEELESLQKRNVYELVKLPPGRKAIKNRWVFAIKSDGRKRARLVAKGFSQVEGLDYDEIFSPVVRFESVRLLLALAALENWHMTALDVKTAFLYGQLDEEIYMEQPEGFKVKGQEFKVLRLRRTLYGLKQASLAWWKELDKSVRKLGFKRLYAHTGIFVSRHKDGTILVMLAYVDDILFMGPNIKLLKDKKALFMDSGNVVIARNFFKFEL